jgi:hypothetical protein
MNKSLAYCGLVCNSCPIHLATIEEDLSHQATMRISIAEQINQEYGTDYKSSNINDCDGCRANTERLFSGCLNCEIRKCARLKNLENCAHCSEYSCKILEEFLQHDPDARNRLDNI